MIGKIEPQSEGRVEVRFRLFDVAEAVAARELFLRGGARAAARHRPPHRRPDLRAAHGRQGRVLDQDHLRGEARRAATSCRWPTPTASTRRRVLASNEPIMSPSWSPDGSRLAYVSFDQKKPIVVVQNLAQGTTRVVANFRGNNSAPAWSPDGRTSLVALSKDGLTQIYRMPATGGEAPAPHRLRRASTRSRRLLAGWPMDRLHLRSRRLAAGLPHAGRGRAAASASRSRARTTSARASAPTASRSPTCTARAGASASPLLELATGQCAGAHRGDPGRFPSFAPNGKMILYEASGRRARPARRGLRGRAGAPAAHLRRGRRAGPRVGPDAHQLTGRRRNLMQHSLFQH